MEEFYYEESSLKHVFVKCLIIILVLGICFGVFCFYRKENTIRLKYITLEVGDDLSNNVIDYLENGERFSDEYKLSLKDVNTNMVGEYTYTVKYNKHIEKGKIKVVDTTKPVIETSDVIIGVNEELKLDSLITSCKDNSLPCKVSFKNEKDVNKLKKVGEYEIDVEVSDAVGNITETTVKITTSTTETMSSLQTDDLNYFTNSENDDRIDHVLFLELDKAIDEETLEYEGLIQELSTVDFSEYLNDDEELYDVKLITVYNKYSYVIGFQVLATFTDGNTRLLTK